ncbi:UPF0146 family protein [Halorubrum laminariae]|uniref:UPF0146 family protein n=1 Tax=Halorubrum laminariae TaxID=1433523 RepID=A0ABD6C258_9EURY|nr:UPF0146 family protein [Halorubrum laminariae]
MVSSPRCALVESLSRYERLIEVGIGDRPEVALALADRDRDVFAIDVDVGDRVREAEDGIRGRNGSRDGSLRAVRADVLALADERAQLTPSGALPRSVDAVYACNLPAELQRPTVRLAARLDAACLFTTLGFEEPTVAVRRRSLDGTTLYVAREGTETGDSGADSEAGDGGAGSG